MSRDYKEDGGGWKKLPFTHHGRQVLGSPPKAVHLVSFLGSLSFLEEAGPIAATHNTCMDSAMLCLLTS